jgi:hypothetical protein
MATARAASSGFGDGQRAISLVVEQLSPHRFVLPV